MKILLQFGILLTLISCGAESQKSDLEFYPIKKESFNKYINAEKASDDIDLSKDIHIVNRDYPIEISIYEDGKWYYNLDNLDDGFGTWKYKNGRLELFAHRTLFDMNINIEGTAEGAPNVVLKFSDRFGPRTIQVEKRNLK
jgi:hypothetical protein